MEEERRKGRRTDKIGDFVGLELFVKHGVEGDRLVLLQAVVHSEHERANVELDGNNLSKRTGSIDMIYKMK